MLLSIARRLSNCNGKEPNYVLGFVLTVVAGLATVLGCLAICCIKNKQNPKKVTAAALGFAAGVMMYVSFIDVLGAEAKEFFEDHFHPVDCGRLLNTTDHEEIPEQEEDQSILIRISIAGFFFFGIFMATGLDKLVDVCFAHSHHKEALSDEDSEENSQATNSDHERGSSLERVSFVTFLALSMHNFPEGLATFFGGGTGSFTVPVAIAMHNIPEGMAIAVPLYQSSGSVFKAVKNTFICGLAQPLGAAIGWLLIIAFKLDDLPSFVYGAVYALTAGVMVCVSIMELLPEAFASAPAAFVAWFVFAGFALMEISIMLLEASGA